MAFGSEIIARLGLDTSAFAAGVEKAKSSASVGFEDVGKVIRKKLDFKDLFKGLIQGLGIASVANISEKIVEPFKESAESAQRIAEYSDRAAAATERMLALRKNDLQQLASMETQLKRINSELVKQVSETPSKSYLGGLIQRGSAFDKLFGLSRREDAARAESVKQHEVAAAEKSLEIETKRQQIEEKNFEQLIRNANVRAEFVDKNREQVELEAKVLSGRILPAEQARLEVLHQQQKIRENEQRIDDILQVYPEQRTAQEKQTLAQLFAQRDVLGEQLGKFQEIHAALTKQEDKAISFSELLTSGAHTWAEAQAAWNRQIDETIDKLHKEWEGLKLIIDTTGRGDRALSDRELERKSANLRQDIFARETSLFGQAGLAGSPPFDPLLDPQRNNLRQLLAEQDLRQRVRQSAAVFGEDAAFRQFDGLTEQRFRDILSGTPESLKIATDTRDSIQELTNLFKSGQATARTLPLATPGGG